MSVNSKNIVALILAAGKSSRLGQAKQNLSYGNSTLLNHIKEQLNLYLVDKTFVVVGAYAEIIRQESKLQESEVVEFRGWEEGMGSSLAYACGTIFKQKKYDGILITLSDLPLVNRKDYQEMIDLFESDNDIVATKANNQLGVPAIFGADYFEELLQIKGKKGAKPLINKYRHKVTVYENEKAASDIDSLNDYIDLIKKK